MIARVIVTPKPVVNDPQGITVTHGLHALGFGEVVNVRVGKYIEVLLDDDSVEETGRRIDDMCRRLLANQVIEDYRFELDPLPATAGLSPSPPDPPHEIRTPPPRFRGDPGEGEGRGGGE